MSSDACSVLSGTSCYHCGDTCREGGVVHQGKPFCCSGCRMVYDILADNGLDTYYQLESQPGVSARQSRNSRFEYLDDASVVARLSDFQNESTVAVSLYIPHIHCTSCVWLLENLYKLEAGISRCSVNFLKRELSLTYNSEQTSLRSIVRRLASIGYEPELRLEKLEASHTRTPDRQLWLKLGVAGFAFGNIMLFSFPEYLSGSTLSADGAFHTVFGILNVAIALPVLFYSSSDYLRSAWAALRQGGINLDVPISIGILALFTRSVYEIAAGIGPGYMDSLTGLVFFLLIGRLVQQKTYEQLSFDRDYRSYLPISVDVRQTGGSLTAVAIDRLKEGDRLRIRNNELVPADAVLLTDRCFIDYSFITGESDPVEVPQGEVIYAGGKVMGAAAEMSTIKEVSSSYLTRLWNDAAFREQEQATAKVTSLADRISPHFTLAVLGIAGVSAILWSSVSVPTALSVFTAVLIIACPCALALSTPFTLGSTLNILGRNGLYVKSAGVIEQLARATTLVFDKTGTLTRTDRAEVSFHGQPLVPGEQRLIRSLCLQSVHPLSRTLAGFLSGAESPVIRQYEETVGRGMRARVEGTPVALGSAAFMEEVLDRFDGADPTGDEATSVVFVAVDGTCRGWFEVSNAYRTGLRHTLKRFRDRFSTYLLSGDNENQRKQFAECFREQALRFNQSPRQKLDFISRRQQAGERVVMVGDGLNDAGALKKSDFGIALTDNISAFTPACDAIMEGDALQQLDRFIDFARAGLTTIRLSFGLSLLYNITGLGFAVSGHLTPLTAAVLMPLSSISIMVFTTGLTYWNAKRIGLKRWK